MSKPDIVRAVVTQASPLRVRIEGPDATALAVTPDNYAGTLTVDDTVLVARYPRGQIEVLARLGGPAVPAATPDTNPNLLRNGSFRTNQRAYASGTDLALNAYGFDGWKATTANSRMTFTAAPQGQPVTIPSGDSWAQVIERADIDPGAHTVGHAGTAQVRIYNVGATPPAYAASPVTATLDGSANVIVEAGPGTVEKIKCERGGVATPFVVDSIDDELARCLRYLQRRGGRDAYERVGFGMAESATGLAILVDLTVPMRAAPTWTINALAAFDGATITAISTVALTQPGVAVAKATLSASGLTQFRPYQLLTNNNLAGFLELSAEL